MGEDDRTWGDATTLADAWEILHSVRIVAHSKVPLRPERIGRMVASVVAARKVAAAASDEPFRIDAVRLACGWEMACTVTPCLNAETSKPQTSAVAKELEAITAWVVDLTAQWDTEMASVHAELQRRPAYAAEAVGVELASMPFSHGGDA